MARSVKTGVLVLERDGLAVFLSRSGKFLRVGYLALFYASPELKISHKIQDKWPSGRPLISVIIPCFNYGRFIIEAIMSVQKQTFQNFELIIINDGSDQKETLDVLDSINHPKARVIHQKNRGLAETRNVGAENALGKYVCFLDADDTLEPTYLEKTIHRLEKDETLGCCYSWVKCFEGDDFDWKTEDLDPIKLREGNIAPSHSVFRKVAWEKVRESNGSGFLKGFDGNFEDWVFLIDLVQCGFRGEVIQEFLINYRIHKTSLSSTNKERYGKSLEKLKRERRKFFRDRTYLKKMQENMSRRIIVDNYTENLK